MGTRMIDIKTRDYPQVVCKTRMGKEKVIPARWERSYLYKGRELAKTYSTSEAIHLRTDYTLVDFSKTLYTRALEGKYADGYRELFALLHADETTKFTEFTYA